jgi:hypothetical protein
MTKRAYQQLKGELDIAMAQMQRLQGENQDLRTALNSHGDSVSELESRMTTLQVKPCILMLVRRTNHFL